MAGPRTSLLTKGAHRTTQISHCIFSGPLLIPAAAFLPEGDRAFTSWEVRLERLLARKMVDLRPFSYEEMGGKRGVGTGGTAESL